MDPVQNFNMPYLFYHHDLFAYQHSLNNGTILNISRYDDYEIFKEIRL